MREDATRRAGELEVQLAAADFATPLVTVHAPALSNGGEHLARLRSSQPLTARVMRREPMGSTPPVRRRRAGRKFARQFVAAGSLLFVGSLVVVTALPAQAVQSPDVLDPAVAQIEPETQALGAVSTEATTLLSRDEILVRDPVSAARMTADELAGMQAVAGSERAGSSFGGDPAFPRAWELLETDFAQSPFPGIPQLPVSSPFGSRAGGFHGGTDIPLPLGTDILPVANGVVSAVWQGNNPGGGGYAVFIDHNVNGQFVQSWYAHMRPGSIQVEVGQVVDITTVIGQVGSSGISSGPHLHLEMKNANYVSFDPLLWLQNRQMRLENRY